MLSLSSLPEEMVYQVLQNLEVKELVRFGATCQRFSLLAKDERLPAHLLIPKLSQKVIQDNAVLLFNHPERNFSVSKEGKLSLIHPWNIFAKLLQCVDDPSKKIQDAVINTLKEIFRLNLEGYRKADPKTHLSTYVYVWDEHLVKNLGDDQFFYPADYLAKVILKSKWFTYQKIRQLAQLILTQEHLYPRCSSKGIDPRIFQKPVFYDRYTEVSSQSRRAAGWGKKILEMI